MKFPSCRRSSSDLSTGLPDDNSYRSIKSCIVLPEKIGLFARYVGHVYANTAISGLSSLQSSLDTMPLRFQNLCVQDAHGLLFAVHHKFLYLLSYNIDFPNHSLGQKRCVPEKLRDGSYQNGYALSNRLQADTSHTQDNDRKLNLDHNSHSKELLCRKQARSCFFFHSITM